MLVQSQYKTFPQSFISACSLECTLSVRKANTNTPDHFLTESWSGKHLPFYLYLQHLGSISLCYAISLFFLAQIGHALKIPTKTLRLENYCTKEKAVHGSAGEVHSTTQVSRQRRILMPVFLVFWELECQFTSYLSHKSDGMWHRVGLISVFR